MARYLDLEDRLARQPKCKDFKVVFTRGGYIWKGREKVLKYEGERLEDVVTS